MSEETSALDRLLSSTTKSTEKSVEEQLSSATDDDKADFEAMSPGAKHALVSAITETPSNNSKQKRQSRSKDVAPSSSIMDALSTMLLDDLIDQKYTFRQFNANNTAEIIQYIKSKGE